MMSFACDQNAIAPHDTFGPHAIIWTSALWHSAGGWCQGKSGASFNRLAWECTVQITCVRVFALPHSFFYAPATHPVTQCMWVLLLLEKRSRQILRSETLQTQQSDWDNGKNNRVWDTSDTSDSPKGELDRASSIWGGVLTPGGWI